MTVPLKYNVRSLVVRWQATLLAILGIALVVTVFVALSAMSAGFRLALRATGRADNAIVVQQGSNSELTSRIPREYASLLAVDARVARHRSEPLASGEQVVIASLPRKSDGKAANVTVRGIAPIGFAVRGGIGITKGRNFKPGLREMIAGQRIAERVNGLAVGSRMKIQREEFEVVGWFAADGGAFESEVWGDRDTLGPALRRQQYYQSLTLRLKDPTTLAGLDAELRADPRMQLEAQPEREYYEEQSGAVSRPLGALANFVAIVMGIGAVFGAMNTMYAIVAARTREIGTLRALGFSRRSILLAFVIESTFLAVVGGLLGCLLALPADGVAGASGQTASFSEIAFAFKVTATDLARAMAFAVVMGVAGGFLPALRAARLPIAVALREA